MLSMVVGPGQARPVQGEKFPSLEWQEIRLPQGQEQLAIRASRRLTKDELLMVSMAGARLLHEINAIPLWSGSQASPSESNCSRSNFAKYFYLPRIKNSQVLWKRFKMESIELPGGRTHLPNCGFL